ncbi:cysteine hydrolase [Neorhizobium sp. BT27B]|uniref:cysteine hydrolase family protein n=1 Tax=Neorhizobium sp. BT27B TaxID=3142625 RepID=UPI003D276868
MMGRWRHLCIDMQRMFAEDTLWHVEWMNRVLPQVEAAVEWSPDKTVFTRFMPPQNAAQVAGAWRKYYDKWEDMTLERMDIGLIDLIPELKRFVPPAMVFDKATYSPWIGGRLHEDLSRHGVETLVISGGETDFCVMATVLGAVDLGYKVAILSDAVCSGADDTHDAALRLLGDRFSIQLEVVSTEVFLRSASRNG